MGRLARSGAALLMLSIALAAGCKQPKAEPVPAAAPEAKPGHKANEPFERVFYPSGSLKIAAYLYRPAGDGPFPAIVYSHGSRKGAERKDAPMTAIAEMLTAKGYVVLVSERRGYGASEGPTPEDEGETLVPRMNEESDDVVAAYPFLAADSKVDKARVGLLGWSLGGIVTVLALAKSKSFKAGVDQASGSLSWKKNGPLHAALTEAAAKITVPLLSMDAKNDATNESVIAIDEAMAKHHGTHRLVIYPDFVPKHDTKGTPPGHLIFTAEGMPHWQDDVVGWMDQHLKSAR